MIFYDGSQFLLVLFPFLQIDVFLFMQYLNAIQCMGHSWLIKYEGVACFFRSDLQVFCP